MKNLGLSKIEKLLRRNGSSLAGLLNAPVLDEDAAAKDKNHLLVAERSYDRKKMRELHEALLSTVTDEQRQVYEKIYTAVNEGLGGMFFVYGFGGTGKTFLWSLLGAALRSVGLIVLNVASSGIAALLLQGGRTAHSRFGIPLAVNESTTCNFGAGTYQAELIREASLIIWDEAPMMSKHCFETLDRTMRDILKCDEVFGGKVVVLGGDFRQILPIMVNAGRVETVLASVTSSYLWPSCKVLELTKNMRLTRDLDPGRAEEIEAFSKWILDVGNGRINEPNTGEVEIDIPDDLLIPHCEEPIKAIIEDVYGREFFLERRAEFYQGRAILSPRNVDVDAINDYMLSQIPGIWYHIALQEYTV